MFEDALCELCGRAPDERLLTTRDLAWGQPGQFNLMRCRGCGLIITTPRPVPAEIGRYYAPWYDGRPLESIARERAESPLYRFIHWMRLRVLERSGPLTAGMNVLDVGGGLGDQMACFIARRGVRGTTLDFDPATAAASLVRGRAAVCCGDLLEADLPAEAFDVVTLYETLEHVYRPRATLVAARRVLKPGGRLVIEVPDFDSPWRRVFGRYWFAMMTPTHLHHFTKPSLRRVAESAGFAAVRHVATFCPLESALSLLIAYRTATRTREADLTAGWNAWPHVPALLAIGAWAVCGDVPIQAAMWLVGRTGIQTLIARKK